MLKIFFKVYLWGGTKGWLSKSLFPTYWGGVFHKQWSRYLPHLSPPPLSILSNKNLRGGEKKKENIVTRRSRFIVLALRPWSNPGGNKKNFKFIYLRETEDVCLCVCQGTHTRASLWHLESNSGPHACVQCLVHCTTSWATMFKLFK